jgi:hypothetical protein
VDEGWLRETFHQGPWLTENLAVEFKDVDVKFEYSFPPPHRITKTDSHKSEDWEDEENDEAEGDGKNGEDERRLLHSTNHAIEKRRRKHSARTFQTGT